MRAIRNLGGALLVIPVALLLGVGVVLALVSTAIFGWESTSGPDAS